MTGAPRDRPDGPGASVVHARLVELIDRLTVHDSRIRRHEPGGVHKMRVTLRRLRSLLATFSPPFDTAVAEPLRDELKWVAGELGGARESEVLHKRLAALVSSAEERSLADRIDWQLGAAESAGLDRALAALDSDRYSALLRDLTSFATEPPWTDEEHGSGDDVLRSRVWREWKRLRRRAKTASKAPRPEERQVALHEVRKAAKRLRYSAESLVPLYGDDARRLSRQAKRLQTELGEVQDSAVSQGVLQAMAAEPDTAADEAFVLGGLHAQERLLSVHAQARYAGAWDKLARTKNRQWLR